MQSGLDPGVHGCPGTSAGAVVDVDGGTVNGAVILGVEAADGGVGDVSSVVVVTSLVEVVSETVVAVEPLPPSDPSEPHPVNTVVATSAPHTRSTRAHLIPPHDAAATTSHRSSPG
jgi:hypothetical protein